MPVGLFLVKQFIDQVPTSLVEAAQIDGASDYYILIKIIMPLITPAIATIAILTFQLAWNNTEASVLYINNESLKTFAFYMSALTSTTGNTVAGQGMSAAASLIMFLPNLILFIILQSRVMNTMVHSGIK
jgi:multiple sugar transport system permease protein